MVTVTAPRSSKMPSRAEVWSPPDASSGVGPRLSSTLSISASPGIPGPLRRPSMMIRPTARPFRPSSGISASAWAKISKRSGVMRRKKPPNRRIASAAFSSATPPSLIFSEPTISIENDCAGSTKVWPSASRSTRPVLLLNLRKKDGPNFLASAASRVMIFHSWPRMMVCTLAPARFIACTPARAASVSRPESVLVQSVGRATSPSTAVDSALTDNASLVWMVSPGMPSSAIFSVFSDEVVLICSTASPSAKMP